MRGGEESNMPGDRCIGANDRVLREGGRVVMMGRGRAWRRQWVTNLSLEWDCSVWKGMGPHCRGWLVLYSNTHSGVMHLHSTIIHWYSNQCVCSFSNRS